MVKRDIWRVGFENYDLLNAVKKAYKDVKGVELSQKQVISVILKNPSIIRNDKIKRYLNAKES